MKNRKITMGIILGAVILGMAMPASVSAGEPATEFELSEEKLIRNKEGRVVGIDITEELPEVKFTSYTLEQLLQTEQFKEYEALGLTYDADSCKLFFAGMEVIDLQDEYKEGAALQYLSYDGWGDGSDESQISVTTVRDEEYHLLYFEFIKQDTDYFPENGLLDTWGSNEIMDDSYGMEEMPESSAIIGGADEPTDIHLAGMLENDIESNN